MKTPCFVAAALLLMSAAPAYADTIKLQCRVGTLDVGPLELDLKSGTFRAIREPVHYRPEIHVLTLWMLLKFEWWVPSRMSKPTWGANGDLNSTQTES